MSFHLKECYHFDDLVEIMKLLRSENGCPWDKEQTHLSIRKNFIEETYEAIEAIDTNDSVLLKEELGDVLLQVVFHAQIEAEQNRFTIDHVANDICKKLIIRHPHIFSNVQANSASEVLNNWDNIKQEQKGIEFASEHLKGVSKALPSLMRAVKVGNRASKAGLDFLDLSQTIKSLESEIQELKQAISMGDELNIKEELGDILLATTNVSRFLALDPEQELSNATDKFIHRFQTVEKLAKNNNTAIKNLNPEELDELWEKVKNVDVNS